MLMMFQSHELPGSNSQLTTRKANALGEGHPQSIETLRECNGDFAPIDIEHFSKVRFLSGNRIGQYL